MGKGYFYFRLLLPDAIISFMIRLLILLPVLLFIKPMGALGQTGADRAKALALFNATTPLFIKLMDFNVSNRDSALIINKELIAKLEEIYTADTSNPSVGHYLMTCYKIEGNFRAVIKWAKNQVMYSKYPINKADYAYYIIGAYISLAELDSAKIYFSQTIAMLEKINTPKESLVPYAIKDLISTFTKWANSIYSNTDTITVKQLQLKGIQPCTYAIQMLTYIQPFTEKYFDKIFNAAAKKDIIYKKKNCR
jgi:tetratricopeptide (TPR) repeat protein